MSEKLLLQYGFELSNIESIYKTYVKDGFYIIEKPDESYWYSNMGFDYPIKSEDDLKKIYFEVRRKKLK